MATSAQPTASANPYATLPFTLQAINDKEPGAFYFIDSTGVVVGRIEGSFHGSEYDIDPNDKGDGVVHPNAGNSDFYIKGAWVGGEMVTLRSKLGGAPAGTDNWPVAIPVATNNDGSNWTAAQCSSFRGPVKGGPNAGPDLAPTLKQVGDQIVPVATPAPAPAPEAPPSPTPSTPTPVGDPLPEEHAAVHVSILERLKELGRRVRLGLVSDTRTLGEEIESWAEKHL